MPKRVRGKAKKDRAIPIERIAKDILGFRYRGNEKALRGLLDWRERVLQLARRIDGCRAEMDHLLDGLSGGYIPSGPSGCPTRGKVDVLPTGKNFYALDPQKIPSKAAWRVGRVLATRLIERYEADTGELPENAGMVLFCTDMMWTEGEQVAQILYLLGVEPTWAESGRVRGLRIIPLSELNRPRIDVTLRIGGIVRDAFPCVVELMDEAVRRVAFLEEPEEMNFVRKHSLERMKGQDTPQERLRAATRIFGSRPGTYGSGVNLAVYASAWNEEKDLSDVFIYFGGFAYGKDRYGEPAHDELMDSLSSVDLTFKNQPTDEHDIFGCCCHFSYQGGLTAAAHSLSGREVKSYHGDTRNPRIPEVRDLGEEIKRVVRTKLLNPAWIESMKEHGYRGASDMTKRIGRVYGWQATTRAVEGWVFDDITRTYVLDEEMREWFKENNPWALEEIGRRLLEANRRSLWEADPEVLKELMRVQLELEGDLEERMGEVQGDFQGGSVDILTMEKVQDWNEMMKTVKEKIHGRSGRK
ncbi:MAG: cobaltochelatase subunit CobN [candidate division NC10 bacterium]|nr:cobaltochelatase subunit CobN [candidate division NC10 bacterium]